MVKLLLGLTAAPSPHDAADALAVAICHLHSHGHRDRDRDRDRPNPESRIPSQDSPASWRQYRPPAAG